MLIGGVSGLAGAARPRAIIALLNRGSRSASARSFLAESPVEVPASKAPRLWVITRGWGARVRQVDAGHRQIFNFLLPGDSFATGAGAHGPRTAVMALTSMQVTPVDEIAGEDEAPFGRLSGLEAACRAAAADEVNLVLDHLMRLGQQTALERTAHLLLELTERLAAVHLAEDNSFSLPVRQECLAQALGMSPVHLNRTLQKLKAEGLIAMHGARVTLLQAGRLRRLCAYDSEAQDARFGMSRGQALAS
jgi:CRP-like cAMP-binding protein